MHIQACSTLCIHKYIYINIYIHIHIYAYIHTYTHTYYVQCVHVRIIRRIYIHTYIYIYMHTYIHAQVMYVLYVVCIYVCMYIHMHTHTHTQVMYVLYVVCNIYIHIYICKKLHSYKGLMCLILKSWSYPLTLDILKNEYSPLSTLVIRWKWIFGCIHLHYTLKMNNWVCLYSNTWTAHIINVRLSICMHLSIYIYIYIYI